MTDTKAKWNFAHLHYIVRDMFRWKNWQKVVLSSIGRAFPAIAFVLTGVGMHKMF